MFLIKSCAKKQSTKRESAQLRFQVNSTTASDGGTQKLGSWNLCLAWLWMDCNKNLQPKQTTSWKSVLIFKFSIFFYLRQMTSFMSIEQKFCEEKIFQLQCNNTKQSKFAIKKSAIILVCLVWSQICINLHDMVGGTNSQQHEVCHLSVYTTIQAVCPAQQQCCTTLDLP